MKIGTTELLKFKRLKGRLKLTQWQAIGLLESLWMFTSKNAPAGDVGRCSNEDIAFGIEWDGDPDDLIKVFVDTRWIDESTEHRLVIHDWVDHVPNWLKANFKSHHKTFVGQTPQSHEQPAKQPAQGGEQVAEQVAEQTAEQTAEQAAQASEQSALSTLPSRHATSIQSTPNHETAIHDTPHYPSDPLGSDVGECVGNGPDDPKSRSEMLKNLIFTWQTLPGDKVALIRGVTVPSERDPHPDMSLAASFLAKADLDAFDGLIPHKYVFALEAMHAILFEDALHYRDIPMRPRDFVEEIDSICCGKKTRKARTRTDDIKDNLAEVRSELHEFASNPKTQQKRLS